MKKTTTYSLRNCGFAMSLLLLAFALPSKAQVSAYSFTSTSGTYSQVGLGGTLTPTAGFYDDAVFTPVVTIPFTFTYHGTAFTTIAADPNGTAQLGGPGYTGYTALNGSSNILAPFNSDLYGNTAVGGNVSWATNGVAPNRVFTIQWANWGFYNTALNEASFQIKLYETSNTVQFVYGNCPGTSTNALQVGLNGATSADFNDRTTTTNWAATTAGGNNLAQCTFSAGVKPTSGLTYTWTSAATVAAMTFTSSAGLYIPIQAASAATILSTPAAFYDDNNFSPTATIPFSFTYAGTPFTTVGISANGYVMMGGVTSTFYSQQLANITNCIAGFASDLYGNCTATNVGGELSYNVVGTAPNRQFVIQWSRWGFYSSGLNEFSFQIRLIETSNVVQVVYGNCPGATFGNPQVGLSGSVVTDFNDRTTTTNWAATTAGGSNIATCNFGGGVNPISGQTFTWTPSVTTPTITSFTPSPICPGGTVVITGTNFTGTTAVSVNGVAVTSFIVNSATQITAVLSNNNSTGLITVTNASGNGSSATALTINPRPSVSSITATPSSVCSGGSSQLQISAGLTTSYGVTNIPYSLIPTPGVGVTTLCNGGVATTPLSSGTLDDGGWMNQTIPFAFSYFGSTYTSFAISTNGFMYLGAGAPTTYTGYSNTFPSATPAHPAIAAMYSDLDFRTLGTINYFISGIAPNRILVVNYTGQFYLGTGSMNTQLRIYETSNVIEVHTTSSTGNNLAVEGIQNQAGTTAFTVAGRNATTWAVVTPDGYRWSPNGGPLTYAWTPPTFLNNATIFNPLASGVTATTSYTATVTTAAGCSSTGTVTITAGTPLTSSGNITPSSTVCAGTNITLNSTPAGGGTPYTYAWTGPNSFTSTSQNPTINGVTTAAGGTYTLVITDACAATTTTMVTLTVNPAPIMAVTPTAATYCIPGSPVTLTATGSATYTWGPAAGLSSTTGATVTASPVSTTTYTVTGTLGGCTGTATTIITPSTVPSSVTASSTPTSICPGGSVNLNSSAAGTLNALSENFNASAPGWTITNAPTSPVLCNWSYPSAPLTQNSGSCSFTNFTTVNGGKFAYSNADLGGSGSTTNTVLTSPVFSTVGLTSATLTFEHIYRKWASGDLTVAVEISTDGGGSWAVLKNYLPIGDQGVTTDNAQVPANESIILGPAYLGQSNLKIRFNYVTVWGFYWLVDNVVVSGPATYTYSWTSSPVGFTSTSQNPTGVLPPSTTTYTVTVSNGAGCSTTANTTVTVNPLPTIAATSTPPSICIGSSATLTASGGTSYTWNPGALTGTSVTVNPIATTTYTVSGTDLNGCSNTGLVTVTVNPLPTITANASSSAVCTGSSVTLTGGGGTSYTWTGGVTDGVAFNPPSTTSYTVTGTDGNGCSNTASTTVTVNPLPNVLANTTASSVCTGNSVTLTGSGAISYTWSGGVTNGVAFTPVSTNTYTVTGTDGNGCAGTDNVTVTVNPLPTVTANASATTVCSGSTVTLTGGGATSYTWTGGVTDGVGFVPPSTSTYTVTGTDGNGCDNTASVTINVNALPTVTATTSSSPICNGSSTTLTASGATTYNWMPGSLTGTTVTVSPTATTTYTVTGTNSNGCVNTGNVTVTVNPLPTVAASASSTSICTGNSVVLTGSGASTYGWNPGSLTGTTVTVTPVATTTYTVTGTDANGCVNTANVTITVGAQPVVTVTPPSTSICNGASATLTASGTTSYNWMPGNLTTSSITVNPSSTTSYTVTGTNGPGCLNTATVTVTVNPLPTVTATTSSSPICNGSSATLTGSGASTYNWNPGSLTGTTVSVTPSSSTTYTVTGTDLNGCINTANVTVNVNALPTVTASTTNSAICNGSSTTLTGSGASTYGWNPGSLTGTTVTVSPTATTTYTVTGTDANGCSNTGNVTIIVNPLPTVTATTSNSTICNGSSVTLTGSGASTYGWNPGSLTGTTVTVTPSATTTYTVTGTDGNGCSNTANVTVNVNALPTVTASASSSTICNGSSTTLTGSGASTYGWNPGSLTGTSVIVSPTATTTYTVIGTDANGCTNSANVTVNVNALPTVTASASNSAICNGASTTLTGSGASTYGWNPGSLTGTTVTVTPSSTTTYTVIGTDANGCTNSANVTVTVNPLPVVALGPDVTQCAGTVVLDAQNAGATYLWSDNSTAQTLTASASGTYSVVVTNSFGCTANDAINITINALPVVALGADVTQCGGSVTLDAQNAGSTYLWNDNSTNQTLTVTLSGVYSVVVTTTSGCTATDAINITINPVPVVNLGPDQAVCSGTIPLDAQNAGATYLWSDNSLTQTITATTTGIYWVDVMNSFGCVSRDSVNITINSNPVVTLGADITQCGGTTTLDAGNAGATYLWSDSTVSQFLTVTTSGTYYVLATLTGGCTASDTIVVTINTVPTVTLGADVTQCGGSVTLDAQNAGATYLWSDNSTAQTLSVNTTGNYSVMVTDPSTGCMNSDTAMITINTVPVVALGADIAQCGGSVTLDAQNAGSTYLWSDNSTAQTLSVNTTGNYSVTVTDPSTGCMSSDVITITINATPSVALGPDATQCGGSVTLNAQNAGSTYLWSDNSTNQMLIVTATGNYFVMVTDPSTGCSNGDTIMITINTLPVITFSAADTVCINDAALILSATPVGGAFSGPGVGGSSFSPPTAGLGNATVAYSFTDANGCSASSQQVINVDACTGVVELNNNGSISVFPNPNNGNFTVQITNANGEGVLEVTDALGQIISSESLAPANGSLTKEISLANYSSGVYFVRFTTNNSTSVQKVMIQR